MIIGLFVLQHICECYVQIELFQGHFELPEAVHKKCAFECVNYSVFSILNEASCHGTQNKSVIISAKINNLSK